MSANTGLITESLTCIKIYERTTLDSQKIKVKKNTYIICKLLMSLSETCKSDTLMGHKWINSLSHSLPFATTHFSSSLESFVVVGELFWILKIGLALVYAVTS